jgi:multidrug resistance efflux pump
MVRRFHVQGTNDFLVWAVALLALGLWCVKDGWFPSESVLERHPHTVEIKSAQAGVVREVFVKIGDKRDADQPLVRVLLTQTNAEMILKTPIKGELAGSLIKKDELVRADQTVAVVIPEDSFYTFNRSLAVLALLGSLICAIVHFLVR